MPMSKNSDPPEHLLNYKSGQLVEVLRKRMASLRQANDQLEQYARSLEVAYQTLQEKLADTEKELRRWQANSGVRMGRTLGLLGHNLQQSKAIAFGLITHTLKHSLTAQLDSPKPGAYLDGKLVVSGWAIGDVPNNVQIEVWLNDTCLGLADYNLPRWDVIDNRPWETRPDCGFAGEFQFDRSPFKPGPANLKIQIKGGNSSKYTLNCPVIIGLAGPSNKQMLYQEWIKRTEMIGWDFLAQRATAQGWEYQPLVSLLLQPSSTIKLDLLAALVDSVQAQTYPNWELLIQLPPGTPQELQNLAESYACQDSRVYLYPATDRPGQINDLLKMVHGEYLTLPEADSLLTQDALFKVVQFLNQHQDVTVLYSDEDFIDENGERSQPQFKPDWSPEFFRSRPYNGQLTFYRYEVIKQLSDCGEDADLHTAEAQVYNLSLELFEKTGPFHHLSEVIYHSRHLLNLEKLVDPEVAMVLKRHATRTGQTVTITPGLLPGTLHYRPILEVQPSISIIVPTRDQSEVLRRCLDSVFSLSTYQNYEVIVVDNDSHQAETHQYFSELSRNPRFRRLFFEGAFNFSAINNFAAAQARGELLVFLNNDTEIITPGWLEELAAFAIQPEIGAVGAQLLFPNNTVQHAGVVVGLLGVADHVLKELPAEEPGPFGLAKTLRNVSALTAACLMTRRELFLEVGGFDEINLPVAFNDVDFCLKLRERGLRLVWTPFAELYHYESVSRGLDTSIEKEARLHQEITYMFSRWPGPIARDPYYNPNLSRNRLDYSVDVR